MNGRAFSFALREWQRDFRRRGLWVGLIGAGVILGISGPFDTLRLMSLAPRIAYWLCVAVVSFAIGTFISQITHYMLAGTRPLLRYFISIPLIGICVWLFLTALNLAVFGARPDSLGAVLPGLAVIMAISAVVEIGLCLLQPSPSAPSGPTILARLPFDKRGALIALSATDHYVDVRTTKGSELILMRLRDAIKEAGADGLQVHRSHWVSLRQVVAARKDGNRAILTMSDGAEVPVSKSYVPAIKAAGLLPLS